MNDVISVRGAREHNLKNVNLDIPKNKLVVFTGVSGSGKTSMAMDTIFAEGQRRYVESLSSYARQFLGILKKPDVDRIDGLSPAIAIDQKGISHNPRSTVGTVTEIYDYLRLLFARIGHPHCPNCGRDISSQSASQIAGSIFSNFSEAKVGRRLLILSPLVRDKKGEFGKLLENLKKQGYKFVRIDGRVRALGEEIVLIKTNRHSIEVVIDRVAVVKGVDAVRGRIAQAIERALSLGGGLAVVAEVKDAGFEFPERPEKMIDHLYSERFACPDCNISLPDIEPRLFSFNSPHGACPACQGLGTQLKIDPKLIINPRLTVREGGILPWSKLLERAGWFHELLDQVGEDEKINLNATIELLSRENLDILLYGSGDKFHRVRGSDRHGNDRVFTVRFEGVIPNLERRYRETDSDYIRGEIEKYMVKEPCPICLGSRLKREALSVTVFGKNIAEVSSLSVKESVGWVLELERAKPELSEREVIISKPIISEIESRLSFLDDVGLAYLTIDRPASTLSSGESQRIRLASQIGSGLSGVLYVLDEPSVGLHHRDQNRLIGTLKRLRDLGNSVIVVEHDEATIRSADCVVDFGPEAGEKGGEVVAQGTVADVEASSSSLTGGYLSGRRTIKVKTQIASRSIAQSSKLIIYGCREHNLKNINVEIPLGKFVCVTGVSGSGKSTLVNETLLRALRSQFGLKVEEISGAYRRMEGWENIDKVIDIDQSPIGRTPRSNPATYTKTFDHIRALFSATKDSKIRGYTPGRFSFNVKGGRCEACSGEGQLKIEMQFLPDVYVDCEICGGKRYSRETLEVDYKGKNIAEILDMSVEEALAFFGAIPAIRRNLQTLSDVGLGYVKLGQSAPTLSGGESQRVKLARELAKRETGKTFYILDEPTTGLHFADLEKLLWCLHRLVEGGNTVLVIEHNLDVIRSADFVIDLGPGGGGGGGRVVTAGTVEDVMNCRESYTGQALKNKRG